MTRQTLLTALPYTIAGVATPVLSYVLQPRLCFEHLFLPYVVPVLVILCVAAAVAQSLIPWRPALRLIAGILFAPSILAFLLVPCVSKLEDSHRVIRLGVLSMYLTCVAAAVLGANAVGLLSPGPVRGPRAAAAIGFAIAGMSLAVGSAKQYLGMIGAVRNDPFVALAEARMPMWLMAGVGVAVFGTVAARVQLVRGRSRGAHA